MHENSQSAFLQFGATLPSSPLAYSTKSELAYRHLREMIVNGRIQPGSHLYLEEIARTLGVSTNPVREAFRRLESEGLIVNRPHAGATVAGIDDEQIEVHFMIRGALEGLAVRLAAERVTDEILDHLEGLHRQLIDLVGSGDLAAWNEANIAFHRYVFNCSGSQDLVAMIDLQRDRSPRYRHFPDVLALRAQESQDEHRELIDALRARDGETAERLQRAMASRAGESLRAAMRRGTVQRDGRLDGASLWQRR